MPDSRSEPAGAELWRAVGALWAVYALALVAFAALDWRTGLGDFSLLDPIVIAPFAVLLGATVAVRRRAAGTR